MKNVTKFALSGIFVAAGMVQAHAHATFANPTVPEETTSVIALQVPHGCDGKATTEVQIKLPEGFVFAKPQPKPGWDLEVIQGDYAKTYDNHGKPVTSGPVEIRWKNGDLPDAYYDTFVIQGKVSGVAAGKALAFPATQLCGTEGKVAWDQVAEEGTDPHSLKSPAPTLTVAAKSGGGHGDHAGMAMGGASAAHDAVVKIGELEITGAFTKAMLPGQPVGGGYFIIKNNGQKDDMLVSAASPIAGAVELHEMAMQGEVMKMRKLETGIAIPAGKSVELKPGGLHMMFMKVAEPFKEGGKVPVTLNFEKAGKVDLTLEVEAAGPGGQKQN
ncbi:copper chaperone PCu(A)C [Rhizobium puerariae]|uniref:Copper chaperone PCu(A)C n=1 Tax=Rhizobium puerariae TaxID=1585791 RepID=A0ABV6ARI8_9HYPH